MAQRSQFTSSAPLHWVWPLILLILACGAPVPSNGQAAAPAVPPAAAVAPSIPEVPKREPANVMSWEHADWLEREGRAETEKPEMVIQAIEIREGMSVAEIGAGTGFFSRRLAKAVGTTGKVYAEDIQPQMIDLLKKNMAKDGIANVIPLLGTETDPKLPAGGIDRILLVDVYHEFQKPEPMLAAIRASLAPGGTVTLVEYRLEGETAAHINVKHRMSVEQVLAEWNRAGFLLLNQVETLPSQHLFIFSGKRGARPR
ncbi:MAG TPA: class I SAM-dependent methyltransferase [Thermoanaerobaculia bacterium]|nr:class I SAM-dependent methyltransferase [Thermoanaerobaculia bacterium]